MPYITDAELKDRLAAFLKTSPANLKGYWDTIIPGANQAAHDDITGALILRGYTQAQIDTWDRRVEFAKMIGLYWCLVNGTGAHDYAFETIKLLDRRGDLKTVALHSGGVHDDPDRNGETGLAVYGTLDDEDDTYSRETTW